MSIKGNTLKNLILKKLLRVMNLVDGHIINTLGKVVTVG